MVVILFCQKTHISKVIIAFIIFLFGSHRRLFSYVVYMAGRGGGKGGGKERGGEGGEVLSWVLSPLTMEGQ